MFRISRLAMLTVFVGVMAVGTVSAKEAKIGIVDFQKALMETNEGKSIKGKLESALARKQKEFDRMQEGVKVLKDELETQGPMMKDDLKRQKFQEYQKKMAELQEFYMGNQRELAERESELTEPLLKKFDGIVKKLAKDEGFTLIVHAAGAVYFDTTIDLTARLIKMVNSGTGK